MPDQPAPTPEREPVWEWCPDCASYFTGAHVCDQDRQAILTRVEAKLDRILGLLCNR